MHVYWHCMLCWLDVYFQETISPPSRHRAADPQSWRGGRTGSGDCRAAATNDTGPSGNALVGGVPRVRRPRIEENRSPPAGVIIDTYRMITPLNASNGHENRRFRRAGHGSCLSSLRLERAVHSWRKTVVVRGVMCHVVSAALIAVALGSQLYVHGQSRDACGIRGDLDQTTRRRVRHGRRNTHVAGWDVHHDQPADGFHHRRGVAGAVALQLEARRLIESSPSEPPRTTLAEPVNGP